MAWLPGFPIRWDPETDQIRRFKVEGRRSLDRRLVGLAAFPTHTDDAYGEEHRHLRRWLDRLVGWW